MFFLFASIQTHLNLFFFFTERRISAYQLSTIDSTEDESSSSGKEDSSPESQHQMQPPAPQYGQYLQINGQVPHEGRSRSKKSKQRSKSLQPQSNIVPWRKSSRPRRGRSLEKQPFYPGFKPEPIKSWTEETINLKPAPIEKKVIPKLEAAKVVLKSIKSQRDQGLESIGFTLEKIIQGKTEKEAIPWITMREKLRRVEKVQQQLNKYELDEVYLRPLEMPIYTDQQMPQQASEEQFKRDIEIQRLKSMESLEIMEMTEQIEKLMSQKKEDTIPWKEMRQHLKKVQRVHKEIEKFQIEEVELRHLETQQIVTEESQTATQGQVFMMVDESSKGSIQKIMKKDDMQKYVEVENINKQQYITTEDINLLSVQEREKLEALRIIREQQAMHWRQPREQQQFVQVEDSQLLHIQERQDTEEVSFTQPEAVMWDRGRKKPYQQAQLSEQPQISPAQQVTPKTYEEMHDELVESNHEQLQEQPAPFLWERGKKTTIMQQKTATDMQQSQQIKQETLIKEETQIIEETKQARKRIISSHQQDEKLQKIVLKPTPRQKPKEIQKEELQLQPLKRTQDVQKEEEQPKQAYEEAVDTLQEDIQTQLLEESKAVLWERGRKKPVVKEQEQLQKTYEEAIDQLLEQPQQLTSELPQPVLWERGKKKPAEIQEKPVEELSLKAHEEAIDELIEDTKTEQPKAEPVFWERGKKKAPEAQKDATETIAATVVSQTAEQTILAEQKLQEVKKKVTTKIMPQQKEEKVEQVQLKPTPRPTAKEKPKSEEIQLKPVKRQEAVKGEQITEEPRKGFEEAIDTLEEQAEEQIPQLPKPVGWERGKKKKAPTQQLKELSQDQPDFAYEEAVDVLPEEQKVEKPEQLQPIGWERGKKKRPAVEQVEKESQDQTDFAKIPKEKGKKVKPTAKEIEEVAQEQPELAYEEAVDTLPEIPQEANLEQLQPVAWERGKKKRPASHPAEQITQDHSEKAFEEAVDVLPEEQEKQIPEQPQPVPWIRGKKTLHKLKPDELVEEQVEPIKEDAVVPVLEEEEEQKETIKEIKKKKIKKPKTKSVSETEEIVKDETEIAENIPQDEFEEVQPEIPEEPKRVRKPIPQEPQKPEQIQLKPVQRKQLPKPQEEKLEQVTLKTRRKPTLEEEIRPEEPEEEQFVPLEVTATEEQVVDTIDKKRTKKKKPKKKDVEAETIDAPLVPEEEEVEANEAAVLEEAEMEEIYSEPEETPVKPEDVTKPKSQPETVEEKVEEVKLKPTRKPAKKLPQEETIEEVRLKPVKRSSIKPEEQKLEEVALQHVEKLEDQIVLEEQKKVKKIKKPKHKDLPEIPDTEPVELEAAEHLDLEKEPKLEEAQPQIPWKRGEKKKPIEEPLEEKQWPKGKRRPLEEEQPEEVRLKPIPAKPKEVPVHPEKTVPPPELKPQEGKPSEEKDFEIKPIPVQYDEEPVKEKTKKKKKPKLQKGITSIDEVSGEVVEPFDEPIAEEDQVQEIPIEDIKEVAVSEQILPEEELVPTKETPTAKQKAHKKRTKPLKSISLEEQPELLEATVVSSEEAEKEEEETLHEISQKTILLNKKPEDKRPQFITTEQLIEVDVDTVKRNVEMKVTSNIVKKDRKRITMDDSQPFPELELITEKRVQEGLDKVADEEIIEDEPIRQHEESTTAEVAQQPRKIMKKKKKEIKPPRITEKLRPRMCAPEEPTVLECKVEGIPFPEINWYFNDAILFASEKYEINVVEDVAQLKIAKVTPSDVGIYTCEAKNEAGVATTRTNVVLGKFKKGRLANWFLEIEKEFPSLSYYRTEFLLSFLVFFFSSVIIYLVWLINSLIFTCKYAHSLIEKVSFP